MNKLKLLQLADHLENNVKDENFDMRFWGSKFDDSSWCACAAGHAISLIDPEKFESWKNSGIDGLSSYLDQTVAMIVSEWLEDIYEDVLLYFISFDSWTSKSKVIEILRNVAAS